MRPSTSAPPHDGLVAQSEQLRYLRTKEPKYRAEPLVERLRRADLGDRKAVEHADDIAGRIPGLAGDPAIGREQPNRPSLAIDDNRYKVAHFLPDPAPEGRCLWWRRGGFGDGE